MLKCQKLFLNGHFIMYGFHRIASAVNKTIVTNPRANAKEIVSLLNRAETEDVSIVLFPELTLTGYTASDLFFNQTLIKNQNNALKYILNESINISTIAIIGMALIKNSKLYNVAIIIQNGNILGAVQKVYTK